jgi:hypothetical protein
MWTIPARQERRESQSRSSPDARSQSIYGSNTKDDKYLRPSLRAERATLEPD